MQRLATGNKAQRQTRYHNGFTLIEVLIVIVIIGIVVSIVVINPGDFQSKRTQAFSAQLALMLKTTRQQALLHSAVYGVSCYQTDCEFYRFDSKANSWIAMQTVDKFWKPLAYPNHVFVNIALTDKSAENMALSKGTNPQIIFFPTGEISAFVITINLNDRPQFLIAGTFSGEISTKKI